MEFHLKKIYEEIKKRFSTAQTFDEIFKKYPILNVMPIKGKAVEGYILLESAKWQKGSSIAFIFLTIILILITGFYAIQTYSLNKTSFQVFEIENRPYIRIENFSLRGGQELKMSNQGKLPGQIKRVIFDQEENSDLNSVNKIIFSNEELVLHFTPNFNMKDHIHMKIKVEYNGVGELKDNEYITTLTILKRNEEIFKAKEEYI